VQLLETAVAPLPPVPAIGQPLDETEVAVAS